MKSFELKHIEIMKACLVREIEEDDKEIWFKIYEDLKFYIFLSLSAPNQCEIASDIIKKVFLNEGLRKDVMEVIICLISKEHKKSFSEDLGVIIST